MFFVLEECFLSPPKGGGGRKHIYSEWLFQVKFANVQVLLVWNVDRTILINGNAPSLERNGRPETGLYKRRRIADSEYGSDISVRLYFPKVVILVLSTVRHEQATVSRQFQPLRVVEEGLRSGSIHMPDLSAVLGSADAYDRAVRIDLLDTVVQTVAYVNCSIRSYVKSPHTVERAYRTAPFKDDDERLSFLLKMYEEKRNEEN